MTPERPNATIGITCSSCGSATEVRRTVKHKGDVVTRERRCLTCRDVTVTNERPSLEDHAHLVGEIVKLIARHLKAKGVC